jgi:hypothetical protein
MACPVKAKKNLDAQIVQDITNPDKKFVRLYTNNAGNMGPANSTVTSVLALLTKSHLFPELVGNSEEVVFDFIKSQKSKRKQQDWFDKNANRPIAHIVVEFLQKKAGTKWKNYKQFVGSNNNKPFWNPSSKQRQNLQKLVSKANNKPVDSERPNNQPATFKMYDICMAKDKRRYVDVLLSNNKVERVYLTSQ